MKSVQIDRYGGPEVLIRRDVELPVPKPDEVLIRIQLAKRLGAQVFATTSTAAKAQVARERGADDAMLYDNGRFADAVRAATKGRGVDVVFDAIGQTTLRDSFRATCRRGLVINYGAVSGAVRDLDPLELGEAGSLFLTRPPSGGPPARCGDNPATCGRHICRLARWLASYRRRRTLHSR